MSGADGSAVSAFESGGGGGAGGSIVLSGSQIVTHGGYALNANGGSGGAPGMTGNEGGTGSVGRIWIGGALSAGTLASTPTPVTSPRQLLSLPTTSTM